MTFQTNTMTVATAIGLSIAVIGGVQAAEEPMDLARWSNNVDLNNGWRAEQLYGMSVYGEDGEQVGDVRNIIIGPDNKVTNLIIEFRRTSRYRRHALEGGLGQDFHRRR